MSRPSQAGPMRRQAPMVYPRNRTALVLRDAYCPGPVGNRGGRRRGGEVDEETAGPGARESSCRVERVDEGAVRAGLLVDTEVARSGLAGAWAARRRRATRGQELNVRLVECRCERNPEVHRIADP